MTKFIKVAFLSTGLLLSLGFAGCKKADEAADKAAAAAKGAADTAGNAAGKAAKAAGNAADKTKGAVAGAASKAAGAAGSAMDALKGTGDKASYVKAAVAIGCAGKSMKDKSKFAEKVSQIQKLAGFDGAKWANMAQEVSKDPEASKKIAEGMKSCK